MARVFLLDGTALAFRSHFAFARSGLATADGRATGATYGFTMVLRQLLESEAPERIAVAFDHKDPTFRHTRYTEYKATRQKAPEDLIRQLPWMREVVEAHGIALFEVAGVEADDVIGTLAKQAEAAGDEVFLVTGDKDFMQLVSDHVRMYNVFKSGEATLIQGIAEVAEKFGTTPDHVVDVLAIMGDSSDNVPGVKGIGEKGAIELIQTYGSVDGVLAHLADLKPKQREKVEASRELLLLSRELVTIQTDVPLERGADSLGPAAPDAKRLAQLFRSLEFRSLLDKVQGDLAQKAEAGTRDYRLVEDLDALARMEEELRRAGRFAIDTETTSLFPLEAELVGISFSASVGVAWYVPFNAFPPVHPEGPAALLETLRPLLEDPKLERVGQNTKYDWLVLGSQVPKGVRLPPPAFDTMVASFCAVGPARGHGLDALALHFFGLEKIPTKELIGSGAKQISMKEVEVARVAEYACEDAETTWRLVEPLAAELVEHGAEQLFEELELPLVPVLAAMEERGIRIDTEMLAKQGDELRREQERLEDEVHNLAGEVFNLASTKVLGAILFEKLGIQEEAGVKRVRRTKTGYSTDAATLQEQYGHVPIVQKVLEYRELAKLRSTYVDSLPKYVNPRTGRVHCSFSQVAAATGRLASSDPNLQNIPVRTERGKRLRQAFVPRLPDERGEWTFLACDYSQIELRVLAHLSGDKVLVEAFASGADIHAATASRLFGVAPGDVDRTMRSRAKVINFGLLYGMGAQRVARETGMSQAEAKEFIERYFENFPSVKGWMERLLATARDKGYVETLAGRRRRIPEIASGDQRARVFAENAAINTPVQGSAADIIKKAMLRVEARLAHSKLAGRMLLQVHDELLFELPLTELDETRALVVEEMESAWELLVPLNVDAGHGPDWLAAH